MENPFHCSSKCLQYSWVAAVLVLYHCSICWVGIPREVTRSGKENGSDCACLVLFHHPRRGRLSTAISPFSISNTNYEWYNWQNFLKTNLLVIEAEWFQFCRWCHVTPAVCCRIQDIGQHEVGDGYPFVIRAIAESHLIQVNCWNKYSVAQKQAELKQRDLSLHCVGRSGSVYECTKKQMFLVQTHSFTSYRLTSSDSHVNWSDNVFEMLHELEIFAKLIKSTSCVVSAVGTAKQTKFCHQVRK